MRNMEMLDVVYILRNGVKPDEIRYSLRSVEENFPHRAVWFYGGIPRGIEPDRMVGFQQQGYNKWRKVRDSLIRVCGNDDITEDFYLFNDDFYVMRPFEGYEPLIKGSLMHHVEVLERSIGCSSSYSEQLRSTAVELTRRGMDTLDYTMHTPFLVNRKKALETVCAFPECPMFRTLYGNMHRIGGRVAHDHKIQRIDTLPPEDAMFISTNDKSFRDGKVGEYIRETFTEPSRFEVLNG